MSTAFSEYDDVPSGILIARLNELSNAVANGREAIYREFFMSVPAQFDYDADLVLAGAARRIETLEHRVELLELELEC